MVLPGLLFALTMTALDPAAFVSVSATYVPPARPGGDPAVAVSFQPVSADVQVDREPAPRLALDPGQGVLAEKPVKAVPPPPAAPGASKEDRYLGSLPVYFPVALKAPVKGATPVKGTVTFFYCSTAEGWCRKGVSEVLLQVR